MKRHLSPKILASCAILSLFAFLFSLGAQNLSPSQVQEIRKDAESASQALDKVIPKIEGQELRQETEAARQALGRITEKLQPKEGDVYDGGKKYPPVAYAKMENFEVPTNTTEVHVPVTLDKASVNTVIAFVRVYDGEGGRADPDATKAVIFRPGDPLTKTASFKVRNMSEGSTLKAVQPHVADGGDRRGHGITITAKTGAVNAPVTGGREQLKFEPFGKLTYSATGETIQFNDQGGPNTFSTSMVHGRTQVGNQETGYYGEVALNGFKRTPEGLVLSTRRLPEPVKVGSPAMYYPFLAVMLSGHKTPETQFKYGSIEWVVKMPNRFCSWPALWLLPTGGWPPEIDVYEGFGYNGSWKFSSDLSTNLHGGDKLQRTFTRPAMHMKMSSFGLPNTLDSEFHTFACTVTPEWITMFVDGVETMQYANPFKGENWYPLTNVAVKAKEDSAYDQGSGDMTVKSIKVWRSE